LSGSAREEAYVGIDVSKARLDVALLPTGEPFVVPNAEERGSTSSFLAGSKFCVLPSWSSKPAAASSARSPRCSPQRGST
jgi:hypothetical protein